MKPALPFLLLWMMLAAPLMAQTPPDPTTTPPEIDKTSPKPAAHAKEGTSQVPMATSTQADSAFVAKAGKASATEIAASKLAMSKSKDEDIRTFADHMIREHTKLAEKLAAATRAAKIENPPAQPEEDTMSLLRSLDGDAFDKAYLQHVAVNGHNQALEAFLTQAANDGNPALRKVAKEAVPVLKQHLEMAKALAKK